MQRCGEPHAAQEAAGPSSGLKPACHDRNACSSVSFSTATRTVRNGWTVSRIPSHLLPLDHPLRDDLVHGGFGEGGRNRLARSIAGPIIGQRIGVRVQIGRQLTQVGAQVLEPRRVRPRVPGPHAQF